jgi:hypothetical protein
MEGGIVGRYGGWEEVTAGGKGRGEMRRRNFRRGVVEGGEVEGSEGIMEWSGRGEGTYKL